jgi:hypothetical protein
VSFDVCLANIAIGLADYGLLEVCLGEDPGELAVEVEVEGVDFGGEAFEVIGAFVETGFLDEHVLESPLQE